MGIWWSVTPSRWVLVTKQGPPQQHCASLLPNLKTCSRCALEDPFTRACWRTQGLLAVDVPSATVRLLSSGVTEGNVTQVASATLRGGKGLAGIPSLCRWYSVSFLQAVECLQQHQAWNLQAHIAEGVWGLPCLVPGNAKPFTAPLPCCALQAAARVSFCDDVAIASSGHIYFTDASDLAPQREPSGEFDVLTASQANLLEVGQGRARVIWLHLGEDGQGLHSCT